MKKGSIVQLERRGYFYIDKAADKKGKGMVIHFIPDGRSSNMSKIESKLDQKEVAGGKPSGKAEKAVEAAPTDAPLSKKA